MAGDPFENRTEYIWSRRADPNHNRATIGAMIDERRTE